MELANSVLENLILAGDAVRIPDKCFNFLVTKACQGVLDAKYRDLPESDPLIKDIDKAAVKAAYSALVTIVLEAAKHDSEATAIGSLLEECKYSSDRITAFNDIFMPQKQYIQILLGSIGSGPPHIVDVDWRLDYYIKNNHLEKVNEPVYLVCLKTEVPESSEIKDVQFSCSLEQLQDFVGKLKDATKCLEKTGQL